MTKLPKNWRAVHGIDGTLLYWTRCCANYLVLPTGDGRYQWEWQWQVMGTVDTLHEALLACREHMHSREVSVEQGAA